MDKAILLVATFLLLIGCGSVQNQEDAGSIQSEEKEVSSEISLLPEISVREQAEDSCWIFLTEKEGRYYIDEYEDIPLMKIYIEDGKGQLNVCYGQEGFLFYTLQNIVRQNITDYYCLDDPDGADTMIVKAETLPSGIVVWTIPNPFTQEEDYETIFTVPESRMSAFLTRKEGSSTDNSVSEKNN